VVLCSRIGSHNSTYALTCIEEAVKQAGGTEALGDRFHVFSDGGPHFKSYEFLGSLALQMFEAGGKEVTVTYGAENHFKNPCDSLFGVMDQKIKSASCKNMLKDLPDLVSVFSEWADEQNMEPGRPKLVVKEFWPRPVKEVTKYCLDPDSLPCKISAAYQWEFSSIKDSRRVSVWGRGSNKNTMTALWCLARPFPSCPVDPKSRTHPAIKNLEDEDDIENCGVGEMPVSSIGLTDQEWNGWKLFYRTKMPEQTPSSCYSNRIRKKMEAMGSHASEVPKVQLTKTSKDRQAASDARAKRRCTKAASD